MSTVVLKWSACYFQFTFLLVQISFSCLHLHCLGNSYSMGVVRSLAKGINLTYGCKCWQEIFDLFSFYMSLFSFFGPFCLLYLFWGRRREIGLELYLLPVQLCYHYHISLYDNKHNHFNRPRLLKLGIVEPDLLCCFFVYQWDKTTSSFCTGGRPASMQVH